MHQYSRIAIWFALAGPGYLAAQGTASVSGRVSIVERPGEVTEDLQNVVVYLEPSAAPSRAATGLTAAANGPTNTVIALQSRQFSPRVRVVMQGSKVEFP